MGTGLISPLASSSSPLLPADYSRDDIKVIVMSATLDVEPLIRFFDDAVALRVPGRQHPVSVYYTVEPQPDYLECALLTCLAIHEEEDAGDVLVFLPGQDDIEALATQLSIALKQSTLEFARKRTAKAGTNVEEGQIKWARKTNISRVRPANTDSNSLNDTNDEQMILCAAAEEGITCPHFVVRPFFASASAEQQTAEKKSYQPLLNAQPPEIGAGGGPVPDVDALDAARRLAARDDDQGSSVGSPHPGQNCQKRLGECHLQLCLARLRQTPLPIAVVFFFCRIVALHRLRRGIVAHEG